MIKYLGSKRLLAPLLAEMAVACGASTAVDLFTGTTRVAQALKRRGLQVTAVDLATYSHVLAQCYIATDGADVDESELAEVLVRLDALPGCRGYFTRTFCEDSRFFQPKNGARVDAIRNAIEAEYAGTPLYAVLLTSLMLAADRVDSTTGLQMAYLKSWAPRAHRDLSLVRPDLIAGSGSALCGDAMELVGTLPPVDLMYLDPPYNQHRYFTNYHVWETLVRWDAPEHYGVACKRIDARADTGRSVFNSRRTMAASLADLLRRARAEVLLVSYNDESWIDAAEMVGYLREAGHEDVRVLAFDAKRYVGAQIGVHNAAGVKVGEVGRLRNVEYVFAAGPAEKVEAAVASAAVGTSSAYGQRV